MHPCTCMASVSQSAEKRVGNAGTYLIAQASCCLLVDLERARGPERITHSTVPLRLRRLGVTVSGDARARSGSIYVPLLCGLPVGWVLSASLRLCTRVASVSRPVGIARDGSMCPATRASHHLVVVVERQGGCAFALTWPRCRGQQGSARVIGHIPRCNLSRCLLVVVEWAGCHLLRSGQTRSCPGRKAHQEDPGERRP
jgi:hypothetical protein